MSEFSKSDVAGLLLVALISSGCLGRLIADKGMPEADVQECRSLLDAVRTRFELADFRLPDGLFQTVGTRVTGGDLPRDELWPVQEPRSIGCRTEVRGPLLTLYTVVELWRVTDSREQAGIVELLRERRRQLQNPKPTLIRFLEREVWVVQHDVNGVAFGAGRGHERILTTVTLR